MSNDLSNSINQQLNNLDLTKLEEFFNNLIGNINNENLISIIKNILTGNSSLDLSSLFNYFVSLLFNNILNFLPTFISIIAIGVLMSVLHSARGSFVNESVYEIAYLVFKLAIAIILFSQIFEFYKNTKITIENIAKLSEIMSPIILTLMLAVGGNVSVNVYKPAVLILSNGIISIIINVVFPLIIFMTIFNVINGFSNSIKFDKFSSFAVSTIKWVLGIIVCVFTIFLTIQGLTSARYDGISYKIAKYTISNTVPIIGSFLKDGFDIVIAGSIIIKNAIGFAVIIMIFYIILSPVLNMVVFSLLLKLTSALLEPICDSNISNFCLSISNTITYLIVSLLAVGFMFFILVVLMTLSASAFI